MKNVFLLPIIFLTAITCFSQCDPTISSSDTVGSVKAKLSCLAKLQSDTATKNEELQAQLNKLADENKDLETENEHLKNENKELIDNPPLSLAWSSRSFDPSKFSISDCKSNATHAMVQRGGTPTGDGDTWIVFTIGKELITVECQARAGGLVIVASPNPNGNSTLGKLLADDIFP